MHCQLAYNLGNVLAQLGKSIRIFTSSRRLKSSFARYFLSAIPQLDKLTLFPKFLPEAFSLAPALSASCFPEIRLETTDLS